MTQEAFIYDAVRTPRGRGKAGGALNEVPPVRLVTGLMEALVQRSQLDTEWIDDVVLGCVTPLGDQGGNIAKAAALAAGWHQEVAGFQLNRFCASGLEAINTAAMQVRSGWREAVVAGGVESMSRVPMGSDGGAWAMDPATSFATGFVPQGISADLIATLDGYSRIELDTFALDSHKKAARAWDQGHFTNGVVPVKDVNGVVILERDELVRADADLKTMGSLKPSFAMAGGFGFDEVALGKYPQIESIQHCHTPANSSGIVDGAALVVVGSEGFGQKLGRSPRARILAAALTSTEPTIMLTGPAPATRKALTMAGLSPQDIDLYEVNEAFASVVLRFARELEIDESKINVNGGSIAMGHPLGATGAMILGTLVDELERRDLKRGLATLCVGGGMGVATIVERV